MKSKTHTTKRSTSKQKQKHQSSKTETRARPQSTINRQPRLSLQAKPQSIPGFHSYYARFPVYMPGGTCVSCGMCARRPYTFLSELACATIRCVPPDRNISPGHGLRSCVRGNRAAPDGVEIAAFGVGAGQKARWWVGGLGVCRSGWWYVVVGLAGLLVMRTSVVLLDGALT